MSKSKEDRARKSTEIDPSRAMNETALTNEIEVTMLNNGQNESYN
jgi:hypothetical protein